MPQIALGLLSNKIEFVSIKYPGNATEGNLFLVTIGLGPWLLYSEKPGECTRKSAFWSWIHNCIEGNRAEESSQLESIGLGPSC